MQQKVLWCCCFPCLSVSPTHALLLRYKSVCLPKNLELWGVPLWKRGGGNTCRKGVGGGGVVGTGPAREVCREGVDASRRAWMMSRWSDLLGLHAPDEGTQRGNHVGNPPRSSLVHPPQRGNYVGMPQRALPWPKPPRSALASTSPRSALAETAALFLDLKPRF